MLLATLLMPIVAAGPAAADPVPGDTWVTDGDVDAMAIANGKVYIGGRFTQVGPNTGGGAAVDSATGAYDPSFDRVDGAVFAAVDDGAGGWYIGGDFNSVDGVSRPRVAHLDATGAVTSWRPNITSGAVYALMRSGNTLYIGGEFGDVAGSTRNNIAAVDISSESAVLLAWDPDANAPVRAIESDGGSGILVAGDFTMVGGVTRNRLAQIGAATGAVDAWDPDANAAVNSLAVDGTTVYVGGEFTTVGGTARASIAAVDVTTGALNVWDPGTDGVASAVATDGSVVYVGGSFANAGGATRTNLAAIDVSTGAATTWNPDPDGVVNAVVVDGSEVVVGGEFLTIAGTARERAARLTSVGVVTGFDPDANDTVHALAVAGSTSYIGGLFSSVNGADRGRLAALDATTGVLDPTWAPSADDAVNALEVSADGSVVFVGGAFTTINGGDHRRIAAVSASDGSIDSTFFAQANNIVHALHVADGSLYLGGDFGSVSSNSRKRIAKLDEITGAVATGWDPIVDDSVRDIATSPDGSLVYLGGLFDDIDGVARDEIAALDTATGTVDPTWNPNTNRRIYEFEVTDDEVLVAMGGGGGRVYSFDPTSGTTNWFIQADGDVQTLATRGNHVYAGGHFLNVGPDSRPFFFAADLATGALESTWAPSGQGGLGPFTLVENNGRMWTGGEFTRIAGQSAARVAYLDSIVFAPPGSYRDRVLSDAADVYYRFGETSGVTALDEAGTVDGTYIGNPSLGQPGLIAGSDTAVALDGSGDFIAVPDSDLINTGGPFEERTIEVWFDVDATGSRQVIYEEGGATRGLNLYIENGLVHFGAWNTSDNGDGTTPWPAPIFLTAPVSAGEAHHAVLVFDFDDSLKAFLDGALVAESTSVGRLFAHGNNVAFGAVDGSTRVAGGSTPSPNYLTGTLDEAAVYNSALSEATVAGHYLLGTIDASSPAALVVAPDDGATVTGTTVVAVVAEDAQDAAGTLTVDVSTDNGATWNSAPYQAGSDTYDYTWDTTASPEGGAVLLARVTDTDTNQTISPTRTVIVDNVNNSPTVSIAAPSDGATVGGIVTVEVDASDAEDDIGTLDVDVRFDGGVWQQATWQAGIARYTFSWDTGGLPAGDVAIEARATDSALAETISPAITVTVGAAAPYPALVAADGAQVYWRLGEAGGTNAADEIGSVDGTYSGVSLGAAGLIAADPDTAIDLDGGSDVVEIPDSTLINIGGPFEAKTLELWFNADDVSARGVLYEQGGVTRGMSIYLEGGVLYGGAWNTSDNGDGTTPWPSPAFVSTPVAAGQDYHVVVTYSLAADEVVLYVDGLARDSVGGVGRLFAHSSNVGIGGMRNGSRFVTGGIGGSGFHFNGVIDDVASYGAALDANDVAAHFQAGTGTGSGPIVEIVEPSAAAVVSGSTTVSVAAADDTDAAGSLDIDVRIDGGPWNQSTYSASSGLYEWVWDTSSAPNGAATIEARATDSEPTTTISAPVLVDVSNVSGYSAEVLADSPAVYWRLDETAGSTAVDVVGGVDGTYTGGVLLGLVGLVTDGTSAGLDGVDGFVDVPDSALINLGGPIEERSIELWFSAADVTSRQVIYEEGGNSRGINIYVEDGNLYFGAWNRTNNGDGTTPWAGGEIFLSTPVATDTIHHVVLTLDQPSDELLGYINGVEVVSSGGIGRLYAHGADIGIGAMNNQARFVSGGQTGSGFYLDGQIDEVAVYNSVLSAARVAAHYSSGT
ncbi:MAG: hypothetical protein HKN91_07725 [Acidimicrobiia bacterium]|nr:hypothetical protein [Acidimicrobiia bacterium]